MNKLECIDDIIREHGADVECVDQNPDYSFPEGLPCVNLEIRTAKKVKLYVLVDARFSEDLIQDCVDAYQALRVAASQVKEAGSRKLLQWIQVINISNEEWEKYASKVTVRLELKSLQPVPIQNKPTYSTAKLLYRQTEIPVLN